MNQLKPIINVLFKIIGVNLGLLILLCFLLQANLSYLFYGLDGNFMKLLAFTQSIWAQSDTGFSPNYLQSLGNTSFPVNTNIILGFHILIQNIPFNISASYLIFAIEIFLSAMLACKILDFSMRIQNICGWLFVILMIPVSGLPILDTIMSLAPQTSLLILISTLIIYLISIINKENYILKTFLILILYIYILIAIPVLIILIFPLHIFIYFNILIHFREYKYFIFLIILILLTLLIFNIEYYIVGFFLDTAAYMNSKSFINNRMELSFSSVLYNSLAGFILITSSILGSILHINKNKNIRSLKIDHIYLFYVFLIFSIGFLTTRFNFWQGPSLIYFEWIILPFSLCFSIYFFTYSLNFLSNKFNISNKYKFLYALLFLIIFICSLFIFRNTLKSESFIFNRSVITDYLEKEIKLNPNSFFNGRVATLTGIRSDTKTSWPSLHYHDYLRRENTGNEHRDVGLWNFGIPTLWEYSPLISPFYFKFIQKYLTTDNVLQQRNTVVFDKINNKILGLLGVRFMIVDHPLEGYDLVAKTNSNNMPLFLYSIKNANIKGYSPINIIKVSDQDFTNIDFILSDLTENLYANIIFEENIIKAKSSAINLSNNGINLIAESEGHSVILLPFEYSNCILVKENTNNDFKIFRANYFLIGVYFNKKIDINIVNNFSIFENPKCKFLDYLDYKKSSL